jgi:hypothetical protein
MDTAMGNTTSKMLRFMAVCVVAALAVGYAVLLGWASLGAGGL